MAMFSVTERGSRKSQATLTHQITDAIMWRTHPDAPLRALQGNMRREEERWGETWPLLMTLLSLLMGR